MEGWRVGRDWGLGERMRCGEASETVEVGAVLGDGK